MTDKIKDLQEYLLANGWYATDNQIDDRVSQDWYALLRAHGKASVCIYQTLKEPKE